MNKFTLVSTVFNERKRLEQTISDIENQTLKPDQIVVTDAGSNDGTYEMLLDWKTKSTIEIVVLLRHGCNIAEGRNLAIKTARYDLIVSTDFGCRFNPGWLESLIAPFEDETIEVVGGAFSIIRDEVKNAPSRADYILQNGYPVVMDRFFSASSRSIAYKKYVWEKIGGYCEWLTLAADDTIFWRQIKKAGFQYQLVPKPEVSWLRHKTYKAYAKEAFRYGLGDGEGGINFKNFVSHMLETKLRYLLFLLLIFSPVILVSLHWWLLFLAIPLQFGLRSYKNAYRNYKHLKKEGFFMADLFNAFYLIELSRLQYLKGYIQGWLFASEKVRNGRAKLGVLEV